ncbi:hypothetical protein ACFVXG_18395 [Kitasatospora sp. NPDC058162]|uniref:hypothetical protein n=1 Tax=Kitasatospora sp. NPDC058162 TaxID=3346362 RepID=UPI0036DB4CDD
MPEQHDGTPPATAATLPAGVGDTAVTVASPDGTDPAPQPVPYTVTAGTVSVPLTVAQYAVVTLSAATA